MTTKIYDGQAYDEFTKDVYVSSSRRNTTSFPNANKYTLELAGDINQISEAELIDLQLPYTFYTITLQNNRLYYRNLTSHPPYRHRLPMAWCRRRCNVNRYLYINPGYYSASQLASEIQRLLSEAQVNTAATPELTCVYDASIGKMRFNVNANYNGTGSPWNIFQLCFVDVNDLPLPSAMSWEVGFVKGNTDLNFTRVLTPPTFPDSSSWATSAGFPPDGTYTQDPRYGTLATTGCLMSPNHVSEGTITHLILRLNARLNGPTSTMTGATKTYVGTTITSPSRVPYTDVQSYFGVIPINANPGEYITIGSNNNSYVPKQIYDLPLGNSINSINVEWYTENGDLVDFNGVDHGFTIRFKYLLKRPLGGTFSHEVINEPVRQLRING